MGLGSRQKLLSLQNWRIFFAFFRRARSGRGARDTLDGGSRSLTRQPTFRDVTTFFPAKWRLRDERGNSILMTCHYPDLGSASDWLKQISPPRHDYCVISMEFLRSFLRRPFAGKPVVASGNIGCFLRLVKARKNNSAWTGVIFPRLPQRSTSASCSPEKREKIVPVLQAKNAGDILIYSFFCTH